MTLPTNLIADQLIAEQGTDIIITNSVTSIGENAFKGNQLTSVVIPNSVTSIEGGTFSRNQLTSIEIPDNVTSIENYAFDRNQLTSIEIPDSVTSIREGAFANNQLTSIVIPDSVTLIGSNAFHGNPLEAVSISVDAKFDLRVFPENVNVIIRNGNDEQTPETGPNGTYDLPITTNAVEGTESKDNLRGKKPMIRCWDLAGMTS